MSARVSDRRYDSPIQIDYVRRGIRNSERMWRADRRPGIGRLRISNIHTGSARAEMSILKIQCYEQGPRIYTRSVR